MMTTERMTDPDDMNEIQKEGFKLSHEILYLCNDHSMEAVVSGMISAYSNIMLNEPYGVIEPKDMALAVVSMVEVTLNLIGERDSDTTH